MAAQEEPGAAEDGAADQGGVADLAGAVDQVGAADLAGAPVQDPEESSKLELMKDISKLNLICQEGIWVRYEEVFMHMKARDVLKA